MKQAAKVREAFENIRHKSIGFSLHLRLVVLVMVELVVSFILAALLTWLLETVLPEHIKVPLILELLGFSLIIGGVVTAFMSKLFFDPIRKLGEAMEKVADGDFTVQVETKSSSKEIQEIYSGFNLMTHELNATEVLQTDFVSNVSHEIKTPINAIEGYTMLLQGGDNLSRDQKQYIEKILFNTKRLSDLVGNILLLSKIENQTIQTNQTKYRLDEQIRQSIVAQEPAWSEKDIEFDVEMDSVDYMGNEGIMRHVWDNLISNAIKFNPVGGAVKIRLSLQDEGVIFTIEDNGPGISEDAKKHIFDKFYQGDSSHKEEGNGLGLALVKRILAIAGGEISVENMAGGGSRFTVKLKI